MNGIRINFPFRLGVFIFLAGCSFCQNIVAGLPAGWTDLDIGSPSQAGYATDTNGAWAVAGGGSDIWSAADQFNFVSESVTGDGNMLAQVLTVQNTDPSSGWSKAGVMFRNDTSPGSANAAVVATAGQGVSFQWRNTANGNSSYYDVANLVVPIWVKLVRSNTNFSAFYSSDGTTWTQIGTSQPISMATNFLAGLAVTAHNSSALNTAMFSNVTANLQAPVLSLPVLTNLPAVNIQAQTATLAGEVLSTGNQTPSVVLYYGPNDGGTNAAAWANSVSIGPQSAAFDFGVIGLVTNTTYYFTAMAANSAGAAWASPSQNFTTLTSSVIRPILTYRYDNSRQGVNTNETILTPLNVNVNYFGKLFTYNVDGYVYAQSLVATNVAIPGKGVHNVLYMATENDSVYAFDADSYVPTPYWVTSFINSADGVTTVPEGDAQGNVYPVVGITATPVIDPATGTIYVEAFTKEISGTTTSYMHRLHALDIATGLERTNFNSPAAISCTNYFGAGTPGQNDVDGAGHILWNGLRETCRPALLLANGLVYICYASPGDHPPYYGWVFAFDARTLAQKGVFNDTPNAGYGGIWMTGNGPAADANGYVYLNTGNGTYDTNNNYGDSFLKLGSTNNLQLLDYFTPYNQAMLSAGDLDVSSSGLLLLPDSAGSPAHPHLLLGGSKAKTIYLIDRDNMGHYNPAEDTQIVQSLVNAVGGMWCSPAYLNGIFYIIGKADVLKAFSLTNATMSTNPIAKAPNAIGSGATPSLSANGTNNAIIWAIDNSASGSIGPAILYAYNATNVAQELYDSSQSLARDNPGGAVEFTTPAVANGKVYVGGQYAVSIFGLGVFIPTPTIAPAGGIFTNSQQVILADASPGVTIYYTYDGTTPTTNSAIYTGSITLTNSCILQAMAAEPGAVNSGIASASFINSSALGSGVGLLGAYYAQHASTSPYTGAATLIRTDAVINFNWSSAGPDSSVGETNYTVRWTGSIQPQFNETYTFYATADDGVRLWVNGQQLVNGWVAESATTYQGTIPLKAQQLYNIEMDYFQAGGSAVAELQWSSPSTTEEVVPQTQLYPFTNPPPTVVMLNPTNNSQYTASASITLSAEADAPYNPVSSVSFFANANFLGSVSNLPYTVTATGLVAGSYSLTAVATDGSGLSSTSAPVNVTVVAGTGLPYGLTNRSVTPAFFNMPGTYEGSLPPLLSLTGVFSNTPSMSPAPGLIPYLPNVPLWSDGALKIRYLAVPNNGGQLTPDQQITFSPTGSWTFPNGTVFVKTFELQTNDSDPNSILRLETRLLVRDDNGQVYGVTYKWRADNSDADLLTSSLTQNVSIQTAAGTRTQTWYYPSPADCLTCHTPVANYVLGVNTRQLNHAQFFPATGVTDNQLRTLNQLGLFNPAFDEAGIASFESLSALTNLTASFQERARSYLDANCAQCHQPGGTGITFDARYGTPLAAQNITNFPATFSLGYDHACIVKARDIWRSVIYDRMNIADATNAASVQMPPLARNLIDTNAVAVMGSWINSLPGVPALAPPVINPNGGIFLSSVSVLLQPPDTNATIYYSLDGSLPTTNSFLYAGAFKLAGTTLVSASAFETNFNNSVASSALFLVEPVHFTGQNFLTGGQFQIGFAGMPGSNYVLQATTNFVNWTPLVTNLAVTNLFNLVDPGASNFLFRFYRVEQQ